MNRTELPPDAVWRLEDIYASETLLEQELTRLGEQTQAVAERKGTIGRGAQALRETLDAYYAARLLAERVYSYAHMRRDEDNANGKYQALADRAMGAVVRLEEASSYIAPELLALPEGQAEEWLAQEPGLAVYARHLSEILRMRAHMLDESGERLLAMAGEVLSAPDTIFGMLNHADMKFPAVSDEQGEEVELTHGRYGMLLESPDRRVRKDAYEALYSSYQKQINTLAATYGSSVKSDVFQARVRNYPGALAAALDPREVPESVYTNLTTAVRSHAGDMERYLALRKRVLGLEELRFFDLYVPIARGFDLKLPYEQAAKVVQEGMAPLGDTYARDLAAAFASRWIDVNETTGKTSGAYSWGVYGVHPFVLLNYQPTLDNIFTIAHEMGHAMHSFYSGSHQPYPTAEYVIFVAEVASTVNELLLLEHLLKNAQSKEERAALLNHKLESIRTTVYRQTMFADFERQTHEMCERGEPLTPDSLCALYRKLNEAYYPGVVIDEQIVTEWARIPHFYSAFYVYQYATGFSAAMALSRGILDGKEGALDKYLNFLRSGGSQSPLNLLRGAGVDMETPGPVDACMREFSRTLDELEELLAHG